MKEEEEQRSEDEANAISKESADAVINGSKASAKAKATLQATHESIARANLTESNTKRQ